LTFLIVLVIPELKPFWKRCCKRLDQYQAKLNNRNNILLLNEQKKPRLLELKAEFYKLLAAIGLTNRLFIFDFINLPQWTSGID